MSKTFAWNESCLFEEYEWLEIRDLASQRGFGYPRATQQQDGTYLFISGLPVGDLVALREEVAAGGWTFLPGSRKLHFFQERGSMLENRSLCGKYQLSFYTAMSYTESEDDKCKICFRRYKKLGITRLASPWKAGGWTKLRVGNRRHYFASPGRGLENRSACDRVSLLMETFLDKRHEDPKNCLQCYRVAKRDWFD